MGTLAITAAVALPPTAVSFAKNEQPAAQPNGGATVEDTTTGPIATPQPRRTTRFANVKRPVLALGRAETSGRLRGGGAGRRVTLQRLAGRTWRRVAHTRTGHRGRFRIAFTAPAGTKLRLRYAGDARRRPASARLGGLVAALRAGHASWYGPGLYGNRTACGQTLTPNTMGVAHKTLPCGTVVTFHYRGRTVRAPVLDRGPFVTGREWDLAPGLKRALGFGSTGVVYTDR